MEIYRKNPKSKTYLCPMGKIYFASDFHLGLDAKLKSNEREKLIVQWLDDIKIDASEIFILGDIFDFWFEYKSAVPRGYIRLLGKLAEISDQKIPITIFTGNHDMWLFDYLESELNIPIQRSPITIERQGKTLMIGHGDGLGPGDYKYKMLKKFFANKACQWLFARIHPNFGIGMANFWSQRSRAASTSDGKYLGPDKEWLISYCERQLRSEPNIDYFVFGHRHLCIDYLLSNKKSRYINTGEWLYNQSYAYMEAGQLELTAYKNDSFERFSNYK